MKRKGLLAALVALVVALVVVPRAAYAITTDGAAKSLQNCTIKFTDTTHKCGDTDWWQVYYVKGKTAAATPKFNLYYNGAKVPASAYTVSYRLSWWDESQNKDCYQTWKKPLTPPSNDEEYQIVCKAKAGSGYKGSYTQATAKVVDYYSIGWMTGVFFNKARASWHHAINPMNDNYYVIPQASIKTTLGSFAMYAGCSPAPRGMSKDGTKIPATKYTVTYFKARKNVVAKNLALENAKTGSALAAAPTTAGSYVMIAKGKSPFYGKAYVLFDVQDKMSNVKVKKIANKKYTGKAIRPALTVTYNGVKLVEGTDYKVTYKNNTNKGTATVVLSGCNKIKTNTMGQIETLSSDRFFKGTKVVTFSIV